MSGSFSWKDVGTGDRINDFSDTEIENAVTDSNMIRRYCYSQIFGLETGGMNRGKKRSSVWLNIVHPSLCLHHYNFPLPKTKTTSQERKTQQANELGRR